LLLSGVSDIPTGAVEAEPEFTCVHGLTLKWSAARRALGLDPCSYEVATCGRKPAAEETLAVAD